MSGNQRSQVAPHDSEVDRPSGSRNTPPDYSTRSAESPASPSAQYTAYPTEEKGQRWNDAARDTESAIETIEKVWTPIPLRSWFWLSLVSFMILGAIGLEIALNVTNKNQGWPTGLGFSLEQGFLHYVYTFPPVIVAMILVAMWAWTDIEIKKMQPYVDLLRGDSPAHRSLLLDYTRTNNFVVWTRAAANKHYLVALATLMVLLTLAFQPLAAALLVVRDTWWTLPDFSVTNLAAIGLNQGAEFMDLTSFVTAAGYASAAVLYNLGDPAFVHEGYTIGAFELPRSVVANGTLVANTTAIKSAPGCLPAESLSMVQNPDASGWAINASADGCFLSWSVDKNATNLFGTDVPDCPGSRYNDIPTEFRPVVFWFFTYQPKVASSSTFCTPNISLWDVTVHIDLATGNLTTVIPWRPFDASYSNYSSTSFNVTGPPLNGRAYNGIELPFAQNDRFTIARKDAVKLQLPAAAFEAAESSAEGLIAAFSTNHFVDFSTRVYMTYLKLVASSVYFLPDTSPINVRVTTFRKRLWLNDVAVHLLATAMFLVALIGTMIHLLHRRERQNLHLAHEPGTIASAMSIGAQTHAAGLLDGRRKESEFESALQNKKFRINPTNMKIIMEGEEGYEQAGTPNPRRSFFSLLTPSGKGYAKASPSSPG